MCFNGLEESEHLLVNKSDDQFITDAKRFPSVRLYVAFLSLMGCAIMYMTRVNLNLAILAMANNSPTSVITVNSTDIDTQSQCPYIETDSAVNNSQTIIISEFNWSPPEQGIVLGSFFYGYIWTQIFAGRLSELYGAKYLIVLSILMSGFINLLTPTIARLDFTLFIVSRVVLGSFQGIVYPAFYALFAKWIPEPEHSTFMPWLDAGITSGTVIASVVSGQLISSWGWPSVFYVSGILALVWCIVWCLTITSTPDKHNFISKPEMNYIRMYNHCSNEVKDNKDKAIPWLKILSTKAFFATLVVKVTYGMTFDFMTTKIPAYLQDVIHFPIDQNGYTFSLVMIGFAITLLTCGFMADWVIKSCSLRKTTVRKLFQTISGTGMSIALILIPSVGCNKPLTIAFLTICMLSYGFTSGGDVPIVPDMTEEFAGTVFAVMNTMCSISGFVVPYFVGILIDSNPNSMQLWSYAFYTSAIIDIFGTVVFIVYASAEPQHWGSNEKIDHNINSMSTDVQNIGNEVNKPNSRQTKTCIYYTIP